MGAPYEYSINTNIQAIRKIIRNLGITIRLGTDLDDFSKIVSRQPLRHPLAPAFDPDYECVAHKNVLWMAGYANDGELVCTQAIKLVDLGNNSLGQYLDHRMWEIHPYGYDPEVTETKYFLSDEAKKISGLVTYHGELWMKGGPNGVRGGSLAVMITRLILLECLLRWSPDFLIGLQSPVTACRGLGVRESYLRLEQRSVIWYKETTNELLEGWLVWMSAKEAIFNLRIPAVFFFEMFERDAPIRNQVLANVA